jgi:hypothetical protein
MSEQELSIEGKLIHQVFEFTHRFISEKEAKQLIATIKQAGYVRLAEDQNLPKTPMFANCQLAHVCCIPLQSKYQLGQQDMLKAKFRKVEL